MTGYMEDMMKKNIKHFFLLTALAAGTIHLINRFVNVTAEMKNILKSDNGNYFNWKNGQIFYTKRGTGSPVLLIHDLNPVSSSYEWCRFTKKLEKSHTVYTIDLLGCGRSDKPYLTYTNYLYVQLIMDFIKNVIKEQPDVITTNNSISFVILAQNIDKTLIHKIIAINPPAPEEFNKTPDKYSVIKKFLLETPIIGTFIYNVRTHETRIKTMFYESFFYKPQIVSSKMLDAYYESAHMKLSHGKYLMASIDGNYTANSISHVLRKMETPLYIIESRDLKDGVLNSTEYTKQNSSIETSYIANTKLLPQLENPDKLLDIVHLFLDES